jgi:uncharacterized HAD superfamily protein
MGNLHRIPSDVDLVVGIPRSGMLAANLLALHLNLALTDLDGFVSGRIMGSGLQRKGIGKRCRSIAECRKALIVDDSILSGSEMERARKVVNQSGLESKAIYLAAFCTKDNRYQVDIALDICPTPRAFEWNLMHGHILPQCCVDIDGVLCVDPTPEQNDDGENYEHFLRNAVPLNRPTAKIGVLVTSRLQKYRGQTQEWLARNEIRYGELVMMDYPSMKERQAARAYAQFKADIYRSRGSALFVESSNELSREIARLSGKPTLCTETQVLYSPHGYPHIRQLAKSNIKQSIGLTRRIANKIGKLMSSTS